MKTKKEKEEIKKRERETKEHKKRSDEINRKIPIAYA